MSQIHANAHADTPHTPSSAPETSTAAVAAPAPLSHHLVLDDGTGRKNMQQLIQLRWFAVIGQLLTIGIVHFGLGILLPLHSMLMVLAWLVVFNCASMLRSRIQHEVTNGELFFALLVDVGMLTVQLYLSGGAANPFTFLYLLQVTLSAVLLQAWSTWTMVVITAACLAGLTYLASPLELPFERTPSLGSPVMQGIWVCFVLNAALIVVFITRISRNLRERDARLASLRQRAAEEEHIVRMGLLASGAAHELGTPLATLAVILGDWRRMEPFTSDAELQQEITEMQTQLLRCKSILSGILMSAGEARGEQSMETTICEFLDHLAQEWQRTRPVLEFQFNNDFGHDLPMVSESAIQQMIFNVLDNALDASPHWVGLYISRAQDQLRITVTDQGPGFAPHILEKIGTPYNSSKGRPGGGLGLFLVVNVARTLGGTVTVANRNPVAAAGATAAGAIVTISLPLSSITLEEED